jgi:hypothetical protein
MRRIGRERLEGSGWRKIFLDAPWLPDRKIFFGLPSDRCVKCQELNIHEWMIKQCTVSCCGYFYYGNGQNSNVPKIVFGRRMDVRYWKLGLWCAFSNVLEYPFYFSLLTCNANIGVIRKNLAKSQKSTTVPLHDDVAFMIKCPCFNEPVQVIYNYRYIALSG